jgi:hypothetical protein
MDFCFFLIFSLFLKKIINNTHTHKADLVTGPPTHSVAPPSRCIAELSGYFFYDSGDSFPGGCLAVVCWLLVVGRRECRWLGQAPAPDHPVEGRQPKQEGDFSV